MSYQWRLDGVDIPGATSPVLTLDAVATGQTGRYSVVVSNMAGIGGGISLPYTGIVDRCDVAWNWATNNSGGGIAAPIHLP